MKQLNSKNLQNRLRKKFLKLGVKMFGPETIYFSKDTKIGKNVIIEPYVVFGPKVKIGNNSRVGIGSTIIKNIKSNTTVLVDQKKIILPRKSI